MKLGGCMLEACSNRDMFSCQWKRQKERAWWTLNGKVFQGFRAAPSLVFIWGTSQYSTQSKACEVALNSQLGLYGCKQPLKQGLLTCGLLEVIGPQLPSMVRDGGTFSPVISGVPQVSHACFRASIIAGLESYFGLTVEAKKQPVELLPFIPPVPTAKKRSPAFKNGDGGRK